MTEFIVPLHCISYRAVESSLSSPGQGRVLISLTIGGRAGSPSLRLFTELQAAEDHYAAEMRAASDIQRIFRGALCRFRYERVIVDVNGELFRVRWVEL